MNPRVMQNPLAKDKLEESWPREYKMSVILLKSVESNFY